MVKGDPPVSERVVELYRIGEEPAPLLEEGHRCGKALQPALRPTLRDWDSRNLVEANG